MTEPLEVIPEEHHVKIDKKVTRSFLAVILVAFLVTTYMGYQVKQIRHLSRENRARIDDSATQRKILVRGFKRADIKLCRTQETLKAQNRADARRSFRRLDESLVLLNVPKTPQLIEVARAEKKRKLKLNAPRKHGCGKLPPKIKPILTGE